MATRNSNSVKRIFLLALIVLSMAVAATPASAQAHAYNVLSADVPFKFHIGKHTFHPGHYQFIFVGNGLIAMRDSHKNVVASLITRSVEEGTPPTTSKLLFATRDKRTRLAEIRIANKSQALEILGEQVAMRTTPPQPPPMDGFFMFSDRREVPRLNH